MIARCQTRFTHHLIAMTIRDRGGKVFEIETKTGANLMDVIRTNNIVPKEGYGICNGQETG